MSEAVSLHLLRVAPSSTAMSSICLNSLAENSVVGIPGRLVPDRPPEPDKGPEGAR